MRVSALMNPLSSSDDDSDEGEDWSPYSSRDTSMSDLTSAGSDISMQEVSDLYTDSGLLPPTAVVVSDRLQLIKVLKKSLDLSDGEHVCKSENGTIKNALKLIQRIGSASVNGEAYKSCFPLECTNGSCACHRDAHFVAIKQIPITDDDIFDVQYPTSSEALKFDLWAELLCMRLCNALVENRVCPNLPLYVNYVLCEQGCRFDNPKIDKEPCLILINELANHGDFKTWLTKAPRTVDQWLSAFFQIYAGIYALQKYFNLSHHDLHWGNVLVHELPHDENRYFRYVIDGETYDVPMFKWFFTLWDFGYAKIPDLMEIDKWQWLYAKSEQNPRLLVDYDKITTAVKWTESAGQFVPKEMFEYEDYIHDMFDDGVPVQGILKLFINKYPRQDDNLIVEEYNMDKSISLDRDLYRFVRRGALTERRPTKDEIAARNALQMELQFDAAAMTPYFGEAIFEGPFDKRQSQAVLDSLKKNLKELGDPISVNQFINGSDVAFNKLFRTLTDVKVKLGLKTSSDNLEFAKDKLRCLANMLNEVYSKIVLGDTETFGKITESLHDTILLIWRTS